jgi:hypothetical protein
LVKRLSSKSPSARVRRSLVRRTSSVVLASTLNYSTAVQYLPLSTNVQNGVFWAHVLCSGLAASPPSCATARMGLQGRNMSEISGFLRRPIAEKAKHVQCQVPASIHANNKIHSFFLLLTLSQPHCPQVLSSFAQLSVKGLFHVRLPAPVHDPMG